MPMAPPISVMARNFTWRAISMSLGDVMMFRLPQFIAADHARRRGLVQSSLMRDWSDAGQARPSDANPATISPVRRVKMVPAVGLIDRDWPMTGWDNKEL